MTAAMIRTSVRIRLPCDEFRRSAERPRTIALGLVGPLIALFAGCSFSGRIGETVPTGRLPATAIPRHYEISLSIDPRKERFAGEVTIAVNLTRKTDVIWLHGEGLEPSRVTVRCGPGEQVAATWTEKTDGVVAIRVPQPIGPGDVSLEIAYAARFNERLRGLYRVTVDDDAYAYTQFEPLDARQAFPCFDEPAFKTPFEVSLTVPPGHHAIANTAARETTRLPDGSMRTRFAATVPLPTYLVAFAVGPFDVVDAPEMPPRGVRDRAVPLRGVSAKERGTELGYPLEHTPPLLHAFEDWFGSAFPYEKLDIIAVPDFGSGAMENAGAITFRDSIVLFDGPMSTRNRRVFTSVMAHELAHTWFGNTVTMPWWNDIWLNEAFATWLGNRIVTTVAPEQQAELSMLEGIHRAMQIDGRASARAIRQPIETTHDVHNAFDPITYSKGAGVLAMFEHWMGRDAFRRGVRRYIETHRDGNATTEDLLDALSSVSARDVTRPFETFLVQPGVPLVEARLVCGTTERSIRLRQTRYVPLGGKAPPDGRWQIPVCVRIGTTEGTDEICGLLQDETGSLPLPTATCPQWVMPNAGAAGYYRFTQPPQDLDRLMTHGFSSLPPIERLSVANNLTAGFAAGAALAPTFDALATLAADTNRNTAQAPLRLLWLAREHFAADDQRRAIEALTSELYAPRLVELGWEPKAGESGETALLRGTVIAGLAFTARDPYVRAEAARRAQRYAGIDGSGIADGTALAPDLVDVGLRVLVEEGDARVFDALEAQIHESNHALERSYRLSALGASDKPALVARAQALSLDERLRVNEVALPLWSLMARDSTQESTWTFIEENFDTLVDRTGSDGGGNLPWLVSGLCATDRIDRAEAFLTPRVTALAGGPRNLAGAIESARQCAALKAVQTPALRTYLARGTSVAG